MLKQVEQLLDEGRAVGNKELSEYLEVRGYATAADWVYGRGAEPGEWAAGDPVMLTELRHVHALAMGPAWEVTPHPQATDREVPGTFVNDRRMLARAIVDNLYKFVVPAIAGPARLVPLPSLASEDVSADALRTAANRGRLKASRGADGTWRSSRAWVDEYLAQRDPRGRRRS